MAKIAVLGYGTVGSGVVEVLKTNADVIGVRAEESIDVKYVLDLREFPNDPVMEILTHDYNDILSDDEVSVVVEVMGGIEPAYTFVKQALEKGKSVCTSNKELVARHGAELLAIAKAKAVSFLFGASVGGGIPVIRPFNKSLSSEKIVEIKGILNGTTNYMLSKMTDEGLEYDAILKKAQELGYAERNPAADVEGHDSCRKIAILTALATGKQVDIEDVYTEGITNISKVDIDYVKKMGKAIKLVANAKITDNGVWAKVCPVIIDSKSPLGMVNDVFNAVVVEGNTLGDVMFYGRGAGKLPTASAVVADIIDAVKESGRNIPFIWSSEKLSLNDVKQLEVKRFVRASYQNKDAAASKINEIFGKVKFVELDTLDEEIGFVTAVEKEAEIDNKLNQLINSDCINCVINTIVVED